MQSYLTFDVHAYYNGSLIGTATIKDESIPQRGSRLTLDVIDILKKNINRVVGVVVGEERVYCSSNPGTKEALNDNSLQEKPFLRLDVSEVPQSWPLKP